MSEKRFTEILSTGIVTDNITGKEYKCEMRIDDKLLEVINALHEENERYKSIFFEIVENALEDKNCRELFCKGVLGIFDEANSLDQAKEMIREHLE